MSASWAGWRWDQAMPLPGSTQVGLGKAFLMRWPWQTFVPHADWVAHAAAGGKPPAEGPFASGNDQVRLVYVPGPDAVQVLKLAPGSRQHAVVFDPVTGRTSDLGVLGADAQGALGVAAPAQLDDWVLVLETAP